MTNKIDDEKILIKIKLLFFYKFHTCLLNFK